MTTRPSGKVGCFDCGSLCCLSIYRKFFKATYLLNLQFNQRTLFSIFHSIHPTRHFIALFPVNLGILYNIHPPAATQPIRVSLLYSTLLYSTLHYSTLHVRVVGRLATGYFSERPPPLERFES